MSAALPSLSRDVVTAEVRRGTMRLLADLALAPLAEVPLVTGRRLDLLALAADGTFWAVEIKSSPADLRADSKWPDYLPWADRFFFAVPPDFPIDLLPAGEGVLVADRFEASILREGPVRPLPPARRRALLLRFARLAAARAHGLEDPRPRAAAARRPGSALQQPFVDQEAGDAVGVGQPYRPVGFVE